mgnify:FL=1
MKTTQEKINAAKSRIRELKLLIKLWSKTNG